MRNSARGALRGAFGGLVLAGLAFGTGQAFAAPGAVASVAGACLKEDAAACNANCRETRGAGWVGVCFRDNYGNVSCGCRQLIVP